MTFCKKKDIISEIDDEIMQDNSFIRNTNLISRSSNLSL